MSIQVVSVSRKEGTMKVKMAQGRTRAYQGQKYKWATWLEEPIQHEMETVIAQV